MKIHNLISSPVVVQSLSEFIRFTRVILIKQWLQVAIITIIIIIIGRIKLMNERVDEFFLSRKLLK